jgi:hypothetical protein
MTSICNDCLWFKKETPNMLSYCSNTHSPWPPKSKDVKPDTRACGAYCEKPEPPFILRQPRESLFCFECHTEIDTEGRCRADCYRNPS